MTTPTAPQSLYSFTAFQQGQGNNSFPGTQIDAQFNNLIASINSIITTLAQIQRSDGAVANGSVGTDQLTQAVINLIGSPAGGFNPRGAWAGGTAYVVRDLVSAPDGHSYVCATLNTSSSTWASDLAAGYWVKIA